MHANLVMLPPESHSPLTDLIQIATVLLPTRSESKFANTIDKSRLHERQHSNSSLPG